MLPSWSLYSITSSARGSSVNGTVRPSGLVPIPSELPLSKMKIALLVRQLDLGHILWCGRVVRVKHAHRIRVVRGVQKMLDVSRHGVIDFGHIRFVARDRAVTYVFHEDKFVERCVAQHRAGDIDSACEGWRSRSMSPARVTRQRRQSRRIVWDDRARMRAVVISELEAIRLVYASLRMGRMRSIVGLRERMKRVIGRVLQRVVVAVRGGVGFRIVDRVMIQVCLERLGGVVPGQVARPRRRSRRVVWDLAGMGVAAISASRLVSVNMRMSRISSMVGLRGDMKQVVGGVLQQVVRGDQVELDSRINDCVMVHGWLERGGGVVPVSARWGRL